MAIFLPILAVLSVVASLGASLLMLILLLASGANSSPVQLAQIRIFFWSVLALAAISLIGAIWAFVKAQYGLSTAVGIAPATACVALLVWMLATEW